MAEWSLEGKRIWIAGETGMAGRAIGRALGERKAEIISAPHSMLDLTEQARTFQWIGDHKPDAIFMAAARVGGILANQSHPADFIRDNLSMTLNVIDGAHRAGVSRLLFLGSSCIYPKLAPQPIDEEALMSGPLGPTNEAYAVAKIAGLKLCQFYRRQYGRRYIAAMPTNLYGPYDTFDENASHVIPGLILKLHRAVAEGAGEVCLWGTGRPLREFLHVDDLADALVLMMERYDGELALNIGSGEEVSIASLAEMVGKIAEFEGVIRFDPAYPDGTPRKLLHSRRVQSLGWKPSIRLEDGLSWTYEWYRRAVDLTQRAGRSCASSGR